MSRLRALVGVFVICAISWGLYYVLKPTPKISFTTYSDLSVKNIDPKDYLKLVNLHEACFEEARVKNYLNYAKENLHLGKSRLMIESLVKRQMEQVKQSFPENFSSTKNVTVLREGSEIIGIYSCEIGSEDFDGATVLWNLCVDPNFRGKGYGRKLTEHAIKRCARNGAGLFLLVYKDNLKAKKIYEKQGFTVIPWDYDADNNFEYYNKYLMKYKGKATRNSN